MRRSLRFRLLLLSSASIVVALTIAGFALSALFAEHVHRSLVRDLTAEFNRLAALVDADSHPLRLSQPMSDPRFDLPLSGLYWQVRDPASGEVIRSRSTWTSQLTPELAAAGEQHVGGFPNPQGQPATGVSQRLSFDLEGGGKRQLELLVGEDDAVSDAAVAAYRADLVRDLLLLAAILVVAAWVQVTLGLAPLRRLRAGIRAIRRGEATDLEGIYPSEVQPLVAEVNELTRTHALSVEFARTRAADLAHGIKSGLQVLMAHAYRLREAGDERSADGIESITADLVAVVDHHVGLTRLSRRPASDGASADLVEAVEKIHRAVSATPVGAALSWRVPVDGTIMVAIDRHDLLELLGILMENAAKWSNSAVVASIAAEDAHVSLTIEDDGPGIPEAQLAKLGERGLRLDERRSGSGIGLAIAREIVLLANGRLAFARSPLGGLGVTVTLPGLAGS